MTTSSAPNQGSRAIAVARIATAVFFPFFGEYKVFGSAFAHGGFQEYLRGYLNGSAVSFYRPVLANLVLPHAVFFGYMVGVVELFIGISLLLGIYVRASSIAGMLHMISLAMATWWEPGHGVPTWRYFGAELDHLPLLLLFIVFYATGAGDTWGLDGWRRRGHPEVARSGDDTRAARAN
jgi:thiosulfate dehydrogenase [quinone] large subunit